MKVWISTEREMLPDGTVAERTNVFSSPENVVWYWHGKYGFYVTPPITYLYDEMRKRGEYSIEMRASSDNYVHLRTKEQELDAWYDERCTEPEEGKT